MKVEAINKKDYGILLELDYEIYPTDDPVTKEILDQWYCNNPEFGIVFEENGKIQGMNITIPLNRKGWEGLIKGKLLESELGKKYIFNNSIDHEIGIHIYHIRKFFDKRRFYKDSLIALNNIITELRKKNKTLRVIGFSGLCVTSKGIDLFYNKLNCRESSVIINEHIISKKNKLEILNTNSQKYLNNKLSHGYEYINRCKMLVLYPNEPSVVWRYIEA